MIKLGYKLMSEEHGPSDLVRNAKLAEEGSFEFAAIRTTFLPGWTSRDTRPWLGRFWGRSPTRRSGSA
jgi:hypothetical protein